MDFSRAYNTNRYFASDAGLKSDISWPWIENFDPQNEDWIKIGFSHVFCLRRTAVNEPMIDLIIQNVSLSAESLIGHSKAIH